MRGNRPGLLGFVQGVGAVFELYAPSGALTTYSRRLSIACSRSDSIRFLSVGGTSRISNDSAPRSQSACWDRFNIAWSMDTPHSGHRGAMSPARQ